MLAPYCSFLSLAMSRPNHPSQSRRNLTLSSRSSSTCVYATTMECSCGVLHIIFVATALVAPQLNQHSNLAACCVSLNIYISASMKIVARNICGHPSPQLSNYPQSRMGNTEQSPLTCQCRGHQTLLSLYRRHEFYSRVGRSSLDTPKK